jgi:large subunit ribosomal protein L3
MQYWPRKRAKKALARVRSWTNTKDAKPLAFLGYKVGMAHVIAADGNDKNQKKAVPCTIIECPPLHIVSVRFYRHNRVLTEILNPSLPSILKRSLSLPKKHEKKLDDVKDYDDVRVILYATPDKTSTGKKKPDLFEVALGGDDKLTWVKEHLDKPINVEEVLAENTQVDAHVITTGKGYQGVIKRFGVNLRSHKAEKGQRRVGARSGSWKAQGHMMYRVAQPGQMGYHTRTELNKYILKVEKEGIAPFKHYGAVKNPYILVKGSVGGPAKRAIKLTVASRPSKKIASLKLAIEEVVV